MLKDVRLLAASCLAVVMASCAGGNSPEKIKATALLDEARASFDGGDPDKAIQLLDSLDANYKGETEILRQGMALRPRVMERQTLDMIALNDTMMGIERHTLDSIAALMIKVEVPGAEGYYVARSAYDPRFMDHTGVSGRVSYIGQFYLVSSLNPAGGLRHWSVTASSGGRSVTTDTVPYDGALNYRINNSEVITFSPATSDSIGRLINENRLSPVSISLNGQNGNSSSYAMTAQAIDGIATAYDYARLINSLRSRTIEAEHLQKRLELARSQMSKLEK